MDKACRARWTSYLRNNPSYENNYGHFLQWTRTLIKDNANFESTVYEEYQEAVQREGQSPLDFDAYLSAVERELPEAPDSVRANIFYSKLHRDVRKQIKLSGITALPTTRIEMVSLAQRMWEGLRQDGKRSTYRSPVPQSALNQNSSQNHNHNQSSNDTSHRRGGYRSRGGYRGCGFRARSGPNGHTSQANPQSNAATDNTNTKGKDKNSNGSSSQTKEPGEQRCFNCGKPGHFQNARPEQNERPPRIQHKRTIEEVSDSSDESEKE
jgi:hypothetical protein